MSRQDEFKSETSNPVTKWVEWKSDDKCFSYYDKEKRENVPIPLPFKFLTLAVRHTVKGWNDKSNSAIFSNEVKYIGKEPIKVSSYKGGVIAEGIYKEIKTQIVDAGGKYHKSIYAMTESGQLINIALKGSAAGKWQEFSEKTTKRMSDEFIVVNGAEEGQKGAIKYSTPNFFFEGIITVAQGDDADEAHKELTNYWNGLKPRSEDVATVEEDDDCPI